MRVLPELVPLEPVPSQPLVAGWLGLRKQTKGIDWKLVHRLGGEAVKVIVKGNGPASRAGIETDDYVILINNVSFDEYHRVPRRVGSHVVLKVHREGVGCLVHEAKLWKPPHLRRRRAPKLKPPTIPVRSGQLVAQNERLKWLNLVGSKTYLSPIAKAVAVRLVSGYLNRLEGRAWPAHATLARDLNVSVATVQRALRELVNDGLLLINSHKSSGRTNDYVPTWPAGARGAGNIVRLSPGLGSGR
jgi:Helix-turn-helix domain